MIPSDADKSGLLNFMEFVCALWNLLSLGESDLGVLGYLMKDPTGVLRVKCKKYLWFLLLKGGIVVLLQIPGGTIISSLTDTLACS